MNSVTLRPYQNEAFDISLNELSKNIKRQLIVSATGTGKRILAVEMSKRFDSTLFLAHREELIEQAVTEFDKYFPGQVGVIKGPRLEIGPQYKVVVASAQTIYRRLDKIPADRFKYIAVDEAHHYVAQTFIKPLHYFNPQLMQGYTATPTRLDGLNFSNIFDKIVFEYNLDKAIQEKYLCELDAVRVQTQIDISKLHRVAGDFNQKELAMSVNIPERNNLVVNKYIHYASSRQAIVFCVDIQHSKDMAEAFKMKGIKAVAVHSELDSETRRRINSDFKKKRIDVLTNVEILTEGWDYFDVGAILMARPTQSLALYMQMIGRGTRLKSVEFIEKEHSISILDNLEWDGYDLNKLTYQDRGYTFFKHFNTAGFTENEKNLVLKYYYLSNCKILDFVDNSGKHNLINTWELDKKKPIGEKTFTTTEKNLARLEQEKQKRDVVIKSIYKEDKKVNLLALPEIVIYHRGRMLELATEPQIAWLKREGVWQEGVEYTKGQASEFISNFQASAWQLEQLYKWGYDISNGATVGQFSEIKSLRTQNNEPYVPFKFN